MVEGENPALASAAQLAMDEIELASLGGAVPEKPGQKEPQSGSFERLMQFFAQKKQ